MSVHGAVEHSFLFSRLPAASQYYLNYTLFRAGFSFFLNYFIPSVLPSVIVMAEGKGSSVQSQPLQASLETILEAIRGIHRSHQTATAAMDKSFDDKLEDLRLELSAKQDKACDKLSQKIKEKEKFQFKRKGNELQHTFNEGLKEVIDEALPLLDKPETMERAKQLLKKGSDIISERQKLIKIADRSDQGWKTADEYKRDPIASDSDDEK